MIRKFHVAGLVPAGKFCLVLFLIIISVNGYSQKTTDWHSLLASGANYYDIKAAFTKQNAAKIAELQSLKPDSEEAEENEGEFFDIIQFMRWADFTEPRVAESKGDLRLMHERHTKGLMQVTAMKQKMSQFGNDNWTLIGPKTQQNSMYGNGRVNKIRIDPTNANILYACTPASQLFKSTDGGVSWASISNGLPAAGVGDIDIDPSDPNILYVLSGDTENFDTRAAGVYKSTDGGASWNKLTSLPEPYDFYQFSSIIMNPAVQGSFLVSCDRWIYRFTDGGATVTKVSDDGARDLTVMPGNPNIMFAGSYWDNYGPTKFLRSDNNGITWTAITDGLPTNAYKYAVAVSPANPNMVYVWTCTPSTPHVSQGVFCSTDAGLTFKQMNGGTPNMCGSQGNWNLCLTADPSNAATVYAGGIDLYRSTDSGKTWVNLTNQYSGSPSIGHPDVHGLTFSGASILYVANDGGVYKTTDAGASFTNISSNLSIAQSYGISMSSFNSKLILSGHQDNGTNITSDLTSWDHVLGGDGLLNLIDRTNDNIMFGTIQFNLIYRSMDGGNSFSRVGTSIPRTTWKTPLVQDPQVASTIYAASDKIYKSTDYGTNWTAISPVFDGITGMDVDRNNSNIIYVSTNGGLYKTINGGNNWIPINNGLTDFGTVLNIHVDVNNSAIIYAACSSFFGRNLFRSLDAGATWTVWATGLGGLPAKVVVTQLGAPGEVYCGTDYGVYYRNNAAASWTLFNTNLPPAPVFDLKIFYPTGSLRAATFGRGIWESPLAAAIPSCPVAFANNRAYVDSNASGTNTGENWTNAFKNLQDAIKAASNCGVQKIWVAKGTYYPDRGQGLTSGSRNASFGLKTNLAIYGGFSGNETLLSQRNRALNKTILSGEIGNTGVFGDNSFSVVEAPAVDATAVLDGFTITAGNANADNGTNPASRGGGLYIEVNGSPTIRNCLFVKNYAAFGGAVFTQNNTYPTISNCVFIGNDATYDGSAICNDHEAYTTIVNCSFSGNSTGAIVNTDNSNVVIKNSVIWGNTNGISYIPATVSNSIVQGGYAGTGNLNQNPLFVNQPAIAFGASGNLRLTPCSPAIDAGDDAATTSITDLDGSNRKENLLPNAGVIDMGAYERVGSIATLYVDANAAGKGDGSGWANAYQSFYEALQVYNGCMAVDSVLIAAGTYITPVVGLPFTITKTNGVLLGGYPTGGGSRDPATNQVMIKGEMQVKKSMRIDGIKLQ